MNREMRRKLHLDDSVIGMQFEDLLTVGGKIFFQTHFYPLIKMQRSAREIYLEFKSPEGRVPVLLNVETQSSEHGTEIHCGGMEIANRSRFEKELLEAKKTAEDALLQNADLIHAKNELLQHQQTLESQYRILGSMRQQQQELYKLIAHDLQEPLRKSIFFSDYILKRENLPDQVAEKLTRIMDYNSDMRQMLLTLQRFEELEDRNLRYTRINLNEIFKQAFEESGLPDEKDVDLSYSFPVEVSGDCKLITSLFTELLRYSQKHKDPNSETLKIEISATETQKNIFLESSDRYRYERFTKITYLDNALGFNTDPSKVFTIVQKSAQFNQISIGLAYCKRIIEKHSGNIVAKSVKEKGIGYTIFLPVKSEVEP
ncbi:MAG: HAMP domain-containing histidine kinase [Flavobacterium sp.]|nr:MAG: HAMP domain-containing histidine kinase [Flavobacterium sp.]